MGHATSGCRGTWGRGYLPNMEAKRNATAWCPSPHLALLYSHLANGCCTDSFSLGFVISLPGEILMSYFLIILLKIKNMSLANSLIQEKGIFTCCLNMDELVLPKRTAVTEKFNKEHNHIDSLA